MADSSYLRSLRENALDGQVPVFDATTSRFVLGAGSNPVQAFNVQDLYVATTGSDITGDGSITSPFRTPQKAVDTVGPTGAARIHLASGTYTRPILRNLGGPVIFIGDGAGQPGDDGMTIVQGSTAAGAGTGAATITGAFAPNAFDGFSIQMLTGAAAGARRTIVETLAGDLLPLRQFVVNVPVQNDLYRIVRPAVIFEGWSGTEVWIQKCGSVDARSPNNIVNPNVPPEAGALEAVYLVNIRLDGFGGLNPSVVGSTVVLHGVEGFDSFKFDFRNSGVLIGADTTDGSAINIASLLGIGLDDFAGYGMFLDTPGFDIVIAMTAGSFFGYTMQPGQFVQFGGGLHTVLGGRISLLRAQEAAHVTVTNVAAPQCILGGAAAGSGVAAQDRGTVVLDSNNIVVLATATGIRASQGGRVYAQGGMSVTGTANAAVDVSQAGQCYLRGNPAAGTWAGAVSFRASATETAAVGAFAAVDNTLAAAVLNGSLVTRVS